MRIIPFITGLSFLLTLNTYGAFVPANRPIDALHYKIKIWLDPDTDPKDFRAELQMKFRATAPLKELSLDSEQLKIEKVSMMSPSQDNVVFSTKTPKTLEMKLPSALKKGQVATVLIDYTGKINDAHQGFFKVTDPDDSSRGRSYFTHFEPIAARSFFPCNDEPYDKATTEITVVLPDAYDAISNGKRILPEKKFKRKDNKGYHEVHWMQGRPHSTYLVSLGVAQFGKIVDAGRPEIEVYVGPKKVEKAKFAATVTRKALNFFESYLGTKYPWSKYATIGVPTFIWGGMENTSATHMNEERILINDPSSEFDKDRVVGLAAHELAHQWFGDFVTMKWWDDVWLNESFASLMATLASKQISQTEQPEVDLVATTWDWYFREENGPRSHPIVDTALNSPEEAFDATNYTKGENVLRMLSFYLGEEKFKKGLKQYLTSNAFKNANYQDFFSTMEKASGEKLAQFRDSWLLQKGYPVLTQSGQWDKKTSTYELKISQASNHAGDNALFTFRLPVVFHRKSTPSYHKQVVVEMTAGSVSQNVSLLEEPEWVTVNPGGVVLAKVLPTDREESTLALQALGDPDAVARMWALFELARPITEGGNAKLSKYAEKMLLESLKSDPSPYVRSALLVQIGKTKSRWLPENFGDGLYEIAKSTLSPTFSKNTLFLADPHGWSEFRSSILGSLGRVQKKEALAMVSGILADPKLPLDDVGQAATAVALQSDVSTPELLKKALQVHKNRGYRYQFLILYAFGAYQSPGAASEIREIAKTAGSDLMGRIGGIIQDNQTLKTSAEWSGFLKDFILTDTKFGDEVKSRLLHTIEEVKTSNVQSLLETLMKDSSSPRIKDASKKILEKNFQKVATKDGNSA